MDLNAGVFGQPPLLALLIGHAVQGQLLEPLGVGSIAIGNRLERVQPPSADSHLVIVKVRPGHLGIQDWQANRSHRLGEPHRFGQGQDGEVIGNGVIVVIWMVIYANDLLKTEVR